MARMISRRKTALHLCIGAALAVFLASCPNPGSMSSGSISGHARFAGLSDNSGIVVSAESVDPSGMTVAVRQALARGELSERSIAAQEVTDAEGSYDLSDLAAGTYTVYASSKDSLEKAVRTSVVVTAGGKATAADLSLTPTGSIAGVATLDGAGSGNLGIIVYVAGTSFAALTADDGSFVISAVPAGTGYTLVAGCEGHDPAETTVNVLQGQTTTVTPALDLPTHVPSVVSTVAGAPPASGTTDGMGSAARFYNPSGITTDGTSLYVADSHNNSIRRILIASGIVSTLAGSTAGLQGTTDATGTAARFFDPFAITTDGTNLFVADTSNHTIRKLVIATGVVTTLSGSAGVPGTANGTGGPGGTARFNYPWGITTDGVFLYVADTLSHTIRKVLIATGDVTTLAGSPGVSGAVDDNGSVARFNHPSGITTDGVHLYVADSYNYAIRVVDIATGNVTTLAGSFGNQGSADGAGTAARFNDPEGIVYDGGSLYVTEYSYNTIRRIVVSTGVVSTIAGSPGATGSQDGTGSAARFTSPRGIVVNGPNIYVADYGDHTVRALK